MESDSRQQAMVVRGMRTTPWIARLESSLPLNEHSGEIVTDEQRIALAAVNLNTLALNHALCILNPAAALEALSELRLATSRLKSLLAPQAPAP